MAARQQKQARKGMQDSTPRRAAWNTGPRASPTFSPSVQNARLPNGPQSASSASFPPLSQANGAQRQDRQQQDRVLNQLSGLTGTTITLSTKTNLRYEGSVLSTSGEGDTTGVTLKDVKELTQPGAPLKDTLFIASTNIESWASGPADAKAPNANGHDSFKTDTDISQKGPVRRERELQAWQPTSPEDASHPNAAPHTDDMTFGPGSAQGNNSWDQFAVNEKLFGVKAGFDEDAYTTKLDRSAPGFKEKEKKAQALANEILGSTTTNVHVAEERVKDFVGDSGTNEEEKYGAVVRGANAYVPPGARKANPGGGSASATPKDAPTPTTSTPTGTKPEIPKVSINAPDGSTVAPSTSSGSTSQLTPSASSPSTPGAAGGKPGADPIPAFRTFVSNEKDRLMRKKQALMKNEMDKRMAELVKFSKSFKLKQPIPDDLVPILAKDEEKQRQIKERSTKDAESSHARTIGPLNTLTAANNGSGNGNLGASGSTIIRGAQPPTPASAKPPAAIPEIAKQQAAAAAAAKNGAVGAKAGANGSAAASISAAAKAGGAKRISMFIQPIPPFKPKSQSGQAQPSHSQQQQQQGQQAVDGGASGSSGSGVQNLKGGPLGKVGLPPVHAHLASAAAERNGGMPPMSPTSANRLNVNASSFRPTAAQRNNLSPPGSATASPKPKPSDATAPTQNPFFGNRPIKKGPAVHIKDDFNPFKQTKVAEAAAVASLWPYNGKRYMSLFPPPQTQPQQQSPHMAPPGPPPMPPPSYEEDSAAQAAQRSAYVYAPYPYPYPGQPMMPGMPPPPPGTYMPQFMPHIPYPHMPPPSAMYPAPSMSQMPRKSGMYPGDGTTPTSWVYIAPQAYMPPPPPPGTYPPPPNGAPPRPSMPPTPIPSHAHPYYHQSPQLQHAVPFQMMMPPPGAPGVPHPYDGSQAPPVQMGGVGHA